MKINKENYEEYFLLYADNELTEQERCEVEAFVELNQEYQQEFNDILSTVQSPDNISMDKSFLFKNRADVFINESNREEKFVAYHDGELNEEEKSLVIQFLNENQNHQTEFDRIENARLKPDLNIHYPGIHDLYRRSSKVFYLTLVKYAAVAVLADLFVWFGVNRFTGNSFEETHPVVTQVTKPVNPGEGEVNKVSGGRVRENSRLPETAASESPKEVRLQDLEKKNKITHPEKSSIVDELSARDDKPVQQLIANAPQENNLPFFDNTREAGKIKINADLLQEENLNQLTSMVSIPDTKLAGMSESKMISGEFQSLPEKAEGIFANDFSDDNLRRSKIGILVKKVQRTINRSNPINRWLNGDSGN